MSSSFEISTPERVTIGTVGEPGSRTFYLQAREAERLVTLKLEKQQVAALAQLLAEMLADLPSPGPLPTERDLEEPVLAEWSVGSMQLAHDSSTDRIVIVAEEVEEVEGDVGAGTESSAMEGMGPEDSEVEGPGGPGPTEAGLLGSLGRDGAIGRLVLTREQAAALVEQGAALVSAGRAPCPLCGFPLDPAGHSCPKTNGHGPPKL